MAREIEKNECKTEGGLLKCKRIRVLADGSKVELARISKRVDGNCNPITEDMSGEDKPLEKLNEFVDNRLSVKCKARNTTPSD